MRILAIILNIVALLLLTIQVISTIDFDNKNTTQWFLASALYAFLIINVIGLVSPSMGWVGRVLERKKLEELKRIKVLEKEIKEQDDSN